MPKVSTSLSKQDISTIKALAEARQCSLSNMLADLIQSGLAMQQYPAREQTAMVQEEYLGRLLRLTTDIFRHLYDQEPERRQWACAQERISEINEEVKQHVMKKFQPKS